MIDMISKAVASIGKPKRSSKWPKVRQKHLQSYPVCAACGGGDSLEVHHIKPYHSEPESELDPANLLTLCEAGPFGNCHLLIGHNGSWKDWNPNAPVTATHSCSVVKSIKSALGRPTPK